MIIHIYNERDSIPKTYLNQWKRLRIRAYRTVPQFETKWTKGTPAAVAFLLSEDSKTVLAWAMGIALPPAEYQDEGSPPLPDRPYWHLVVYVKTNMRRKGLGNHVVTALRGFLRATYQLDHVPAVYPHDQASAGFLVKQGLISADVVKDLLKK